jgi:hypothetical protein
MFDFLCCGYVLGKSENWLGEWNSMWFYQEITSHKAGLPLIYNKCRSHSILCPNCSQQLGYYFIDCSIELKELEGKFGLVCKTSNKDNSFCNRINNIIKNIHSIQDTYNILDQNISSLETEILSSIVIIKYIKNKIKY